MFYQTMPLYLGLVELLKTEYRITANLPKQYRYSLGEMILTLTWQMLDLFIEIQHHSYKDTKKLTLIQSMSSCHEKLKLRIRFLGELKLISLKQQALLHTQTTEIGKMIGSWIKNA